MYRLLSVYELKDMDLGSVLLVYVGGAIIKIMITRKRLTRQDRAKGRHLESAKKIALANHFLFLVASSYILTYACKNGDAIKITYLCFYPFRFLVRDVQLSHSYLVHSAAAIGFTIWPIICEIDPPIFPRIVRLACLFSYFPSKKIYLLIE